MRIDGLAPPPLHLPRLVLLAGLALVAGCSGPAATPQARDGVHRGHLSLGPDSDAFLPCGASQPLRVVADPVVGQRLNAEYLTQVGEPYEEAFLRLRGRRLASGDGAGELLEIEQILDLRAADSDDCH